MLIAKHIFFYLQTLCTERTVMKTNHKFPGILQWYEVIQSETKIFSPVLTAINAVNSACHELQVSIETCRRSCSDNNMKDLSRQLNGMITAQVQGGIPKYQEVIWRFVYYICFCVWQGWDNDIQTFKFDLNIPAYTYFGLLYPELISFRTLCFKNFC